MDSGGHAVTHIWRTPLPQLPDVILLRLGVSPQGAKQRLRSAPTHLGQSQGGERYQKTRFLMGRRKIEQKIRFFSTYI